MQENLTQSPIKKPKLINRSNSSNFPSNNITADIYNAKLARKSQTSLEWDQVSRFFF